MARRPRLCAALCCRGEHDLLPAHLLSVHGSGPGRATAGPRSLRAAHGYERAGDATAHDQPGDPQPLAAPGADHPVQPLSRRGQRSGHGRNRRADAQGHQARAEDDQYQGRPHEYHDRLHALLSRTRPADSRARDQHAGVLLHRGEPQGPGAPGNGHRGLPQGAARRDAEAPGRARGARERVPEAIPRRATPADAGEHGHAGESQHPASSEQRQPGPCGGAARLSHGPACRGGILPSRIWSFIRNRRRTTGGAPQQAPPRAGERASSLHGGTPHRGPSQSGNGGHGA